MKHKLDQSGFHHILILLTVIVLAAVSFVGYRVVSKNKSSGGTSAILNGGGSAQDKAIKAGKSLSGGKCQGTGDATFTHLPMNAADFNILIPYGLMVGGHVTPIDHQYFSPTVFNSPRDTYPVYAMADATITDIQPRVKPNGTEYRLVFAHSCTFLYYYDLVTSLTGKVKQTYDKHDFNLAVKAGDQIGAIGGQTLDFAVWNTTKPLTGFVNPASYDGEAWKIYTTDPSPYYTPALRQIVVAKDPRVTEPIAGKIDNDIDGKLAGSWFVQGTGGYGPVNSAPAPDYFKNHLSFSPNLYDPSYFIVSIGSLWGKVEDDPSMQHVTLTNSPNPKDVGVETGLVKYDLVGWRYIKTDGSVWDQMGPAKNVKVSPQTGTPFGCALAQMQQAQLLKFEVFIGKQCSSVAGFDSGAKLYNR